MHAPQTIFPSTQNTAAPPELNHANRTKFVWQTTASTLNSPRLMKTATTAAISASGAMLAPAARSNSVPICPVADLRSAALVRSASTSAATTWSLAMMPKTAVPLDLNVSQGLTAGRAHVGQSTSAHTPRDASQEATAGLAPSALPTAPAHPSASASTETTAVAKVCAAKEVPFASMARARWWTLETTRHPKTRLSTTITTTAREARSQYQAHASPTWQMPSLYQL